MGKETDDPRNKQVKPPFRNEKTQDGPGLEAKMRVKPDFGEESYKGFGRLRDRVALITGGDSGIGRAVALAFAREGADVAIAYLNEHEDAEETKRVVEAAGRRAILLPGDLVDPAHCQRVVDETAKQLGRLDVVVNNAAYQDKAIEKLEELDAARIERAFKVNVVAQLLIIKAALKYLKAGASIINVGSIQAYQPSAPIIDYAASKGAIVTMTKGLGEDLIKRGIRVNCVAPGPVWTPLIVQSFDEEQAQHFGEDSPMKRPAQPVELAPAFVFLASDEARYVNGEVLGVTGGKPLG
jgi:NAD(P)-dependent dehydrogenase (short-subunit alcohol dehydrogenase family)